MLQKDQILGKNYRIIARLGAGGMGMVFRATDINLQREVAVKIMHPDAAKDQSVVQRFLNEGRILAMVRHPVIIEVYAAGVDEPTGIPFLVMEFVEGQTLEDHRDELHKDPAHLLQNMITLLGGIHACHQKGVIHRDLKPANVLIDKTGQLKLVDFGIAKTSAKMTRTGVAIGTPHYMSPEQCLGKAEITAASDIYSLGIMFWELLVGKLPFEAEKDATDPGLSVALQHLNQEPPWPEFEALPVGKNLSGLFRRILAKKPEQRPAIPDIIEALKRELHRLRPADTATGGDTQMIGEIYRIIAEIGAGGMGKVYKALDTTLNRTVAIKVMSEETMKVPGVVERFLQEGQLLATVGHPNVLNIYASGTDRATQRPFLVMEFIDGALLSDLKPALRQNGARLAPLMLQLLEGLRACHAKGIIHRDLKPSNIMVTREGLLKIFDFGIAKAHANLTRTGTTVGTPQYMSPEQCTGKREITAKSDIYSVGIIFWELIFGEPPFKAEEASNPELSIALQHIQATLPMAALPEGSVFLPFLPMVRRMLDKDPANRPEIDEIIATLEQFIEQNPAASGAESALTRRKRLSQQRSSVKSLFDSAQREQQGGGWKIWAGGFLALAAVGLGVWLGLGRPGWPPTPASTPGPEPTSVAGLATTPQPGASPPAPGSDLHPPISPPGAEVAPAVPAGASVAAVPPTTPAVATGSGPSALLPPTGITSLASPDKPEATALTAAATATGAPVASAPLAVAPTPPPAIASAVVTEPPTVSPSLASSPAGESQATATAPTAPSTDLAARAAAFQADLDARLAVLTPPASTAHIAADLQRLATEFERPAEAAQRRQALLDRYAAALLAAREADPVRALAIVEEALVLAPDHPIMAKEKQALLSRLATERAQAEATVQEAERLAREILTRDAPELAERLARLRANGQTALADRLLTQARDGLLERALQAGTAAEFAALQKRGLSLLSATDPARPALEQAFAERRAARQAALLARWQGIIAKHNPEPTPKSLAAKLKTLLEDEGKEVVAKLEPIVRARYLSEARRLAKGNPSQALGILKGLQFLKLPDPDGEARKLHDQLAEKVKAVSSSEQPAPEPVSSAPPSTAEPAVSSTPTADPKLTVEEIVTQLDALTSTENVLGQVETIASLLQALDKKKAKAQAADYRERAVKALIDIAEEHTSYRSWDLANQTLAQARRLSPNHPQIKRVQQLILAGGGTVSEAPATPPDSSSAPPTAPADRPEPGTPGSPPGTPPKTPAAPPAVPAPPPPPADADLPKDKAAIIARLEELVQPDSAATNVGAIIELARRLEKLGAGGKAKELRQKAVRSLIDIAEEHGSYQDYKAAAATYQKVLQIIPNHPEALQGLEVLKGKQ
ncbi:MAG: Serine/threonine protein kinase PrkC, regulator of stationary phase [Candidatus Ozemobacter sibiricus]|uniref:Serine/threonine protein kinase PrkC, regulator of stationary phase n=1 Tax=Candidatus Ozemobacter sibiricus TaxID=2268124 RepID=A0A367ZQV1_9BACT|nr:MAG: Serine/threonine protein kinase PrkC, regulator of stationary phase [Candidatus Ozemobacter sibiricus]